MNLIEAKNSCLIWDVLMPLNGMEADQQPFGQKKGIANFPSDKTGKRAVANVLLIKQN
jgi:hypothetical protein